MVSRKLLPPLAFLAAMLVAVSVQAAAQKVAVVNGPKDGRLGLLSLPILDGYEARVVQGETVYGRKGEKPLIAVGLVSLKGLSGEAFAAGLMKRHSGEDLTPYGDGIFAFELHGGSEPVSIFVVANEDADTGLVLRLYDDGPAGGDVLKQATASTKELQGMLDLVVLSPEERAAKAPSRRE